MRLAAGSLFIGILYELLCLASRTIAQVVLFGDVWYLLASMRAATPQQQTCKICNQPDKLDFHVPDDVWFAVVPARFQNRVVCLYCFDECARENNVDYAASLTTLYFAGR